MVRPINAPFFTPPDGMGGRKPISKTPLVSPEPVAPPQPDPRPPAPPPSGDSGSRKSENKKTPQQAASRQPSRSGFPQDIAWSPEYEPSGIVPYIQAAAAGARDGSEDKTTVVCEALYAADPAGVARGLKFITGCEPDEEQDVLPEFVRLARSVGLDDYLAGQEAWRTARLAPPLNLDASATDFQPTLEQAQTTAEADGFEQPEINLLTQYYLSETYPEWDSSWTKKEDLESFLKGKLKAHVQDFDEESVDWDSPTVHDLIAYYRGQMADATAALWQRDQDMSSENYQQVQAEFDRATALLSVAEDIALDDTEAYAEAFAGTVLIEDEEDEREHVQEQLALIYEHLQVEVPDNYFEGRSATELKYELYSRLNYDVRQFLALDENESRIPQFLKEYQGITGDTPENVVSRLHNNYRQPDVVGFLFVMGLSIAFEPVDYALAAVDVIQALSEGGIESAIGNAILGAAPFVSSKLDDLVQPVLNRVDSIPLLPARAGSLPGQGYQRPGSNYVMAADKYVSRAVSSYNSRNAGLLKTQMERAARVDDNFAWRLKTHSQQQVHHIVPTGRWQGGQGKRNPQ